jgi:CubicO group peptidase (beta-lactamase class C family)
MVGENEPNMRAWISCIAACAFALSPIGVQIASGDEPTSACGIPIDIHDGWALTSPEKQGVDSILLCVMGDGIAGGQLANVDSIVVVRHGVLVYERYFVYPRQQFHADATTRHRGNSMTKSVVSLLVGIAMDRGLIEDLDVPVISYFPEDADLRMPDKDPITLRHLLTMSAGLGSSTTPGVSFQYNDNETELVGAILKKVTGKAVDVLAQENIIAPLGINDVEWHKDPFSGLSTSARGLDLRPRDWAKIGQLVLNGGVWEGKQIVPASWVVQSTSEQIKTAGPPSAEQVKAEGPPSYGYQWWIGRSLDKDRAVQWIAAMGFNSQKTIIIPALDMVVLFNASRQSKNMVAPELDLLDRYILPATSKN